MSLQWQVWSDKGADPWVVEVLRWGYRIPFRVVPTLSKEPIPFPSYGPSSIRGKALDADLLSLVEKGAVELAPLPSPGYYSRLFVVMKASGSWRPVIDLSSLNLKVLKTPFKMETLQSVLLSVQRGGWMVSLDLKDTYLQVPIHPDSRKYLKFVVSGQVYQFKALCFGLSTAPQVFTRVMAPVSVILHRAGIRIRRYLDDWLIQASSRVQVLQDSVSFRASPAQKHVEKLLSIGNEFLSFWLELLGVLASLIALVPGGRLRIWSLQLALRRAWDRLDDSVLVSWNSDCLSDLGWWLDRSRLERGVSLSQVSPNLDFWSDASDVGWGAHLGDSVVSGRWSPQEMVLSINVRELLAVEYGLHYFAPQLVDSTVAVFVDNSTTIAYLRNQGGMKSPLLNSVAQRILHWAESIPVVLAPQFIKAKNKVLADALSMPNQIQGSEWTLKKEVFLELQRRWPVMLDLFATSLNHQCSLYFSPYHDPKALGTDVFLQTWDNYQVFAFPPWSLIPRVLKKLRSSSGVLMTLVAPWWPQRPWFPELLDLMIGGPVSRSSQTASFSSPLSRDIQAVPSCMETLQRFAKLQRFSSRVAKQVGLARRPSSRAGYQSKWLIYRRWCHSEGHSISRPSLSKIADFLFWLRQSRKLSVSAILGYRSMLAVVFRFKLPEISTSPILQDLLRSFKVEVPIRAVRLPPWDLEVQ